MKPNNNVNEGSLARFQVESLDASGKPTIPQSVRYRICDWETGFVLQDWQELTPALLMVCEVPAHLNKFEIAGEFYSNKRAVTIDAVDSAGAPRTEEIHYSIRDLKGIK